LAGKWEPGAAARAHQGSVAATIPLQATATSMDAFHRRLIARPTAKVASIVTITAMGARGAWPSTGTVDSGQVAADPDGQRQSAMGSTGHMVIGQSPPPDQLQDRSQGDETDEDHGEYLLAHTSPSTTTAQAVTEEHRRCRGRRREHLGDDRSDAIQAMVACLLPRQHPLASQLGGRLAGGGRRPPDQLLDWPQRHASRTHRGGTSA
jgi:hypothetical protein